MSAAGLPPTTVPPLPANFVSRDQELDSLVQALLKDRNQRTIALTSVQGMGGIGKTMLVQALCEDARIKAAFPDGILWQSVGKESPWKIEERLRAVCLALDSHCAFTRSGKDHYQLLMREKAALLIVDDVWTVADIEPFLATAPRSRLLFTTRNREIAAGVAAKEYEVALLGQEQARLVFAQWAGKEVEQLPPTAPQIIGECRGLALALAMVGAMLRNKPGTAWERTVKLLRESDLEKIAKEFPGYPYPSLFAAMKVSVDALKPAERERYYALAVLLEEMPASMLVQQALWGTDEDKSVETTEKLIAMSLAQRDGDGAGIRLHDLQLDFVRARFPSESALRLVHGAMRLSSHVITRDPKQFTSQLVGRLLPYENEEEVGRFLWKLESRSPRPWLMTQRPVLDAPGGALVRTLAGRTSLVLGVAISGDGRLAVSASDDHTLKVWEVESGRDLRTLRGHTGEVNGVAMSGDGRLAVSASADHTLKVWEVQSGRELRTLKGHTGQVNGVAMSGDGRLAVSASDDRTLKVWEVQSGRKLRTLKGHTRQVSGVALSKDGRLAVSASYDETLKVWEVESGRDLRTFQDYIGQLLGVALSEDNRLVIYASDDHTLKLREVQSGRELRTLQGHTDLVTGAALSGDGRLVVSSSADETLKVWEVESGRELRTLRGHTGEVNGVAMSGDGRLVVSASFDQTLKVWAVESGREPGIRPSHTGRVLGVATSGDGRLAVSASDDHTLKVWEMESGRELRTLQGHTNWIRGVAMSGDGRLAVSASDDHTLKVWEVESGRELRTLKGHTGDVNRVAMSGDGRLAVSASDDRTLKVWEVESGRELHTLKGHTGDVNGVAMSGDGRLAVSASDDRTLKVWEVESGRELRTLRGHTKLINVVAMSGDGRLVVSASFDQTLKVWEVESGRDLRTLRGHTGEVFGVAMSGDGKRVVSASLDQTLKVWEVESGRETATFTSDRYALCCAFVTSSRMVAGGAGGRVYFLELVLEDRKFEEPKVAVAENDAAIRTEVLMADKKKHVFLSYCRENKAEVTRLRDDLMAAGENVWWDGDIEPGQDWRFEIRKAMKEAYAVLLCLSKELSARISSGVYPEVRDAITAYRQYGPGARFLFPVRLSDCEIPLFEIDDLKMLDSIQHIDLFPPQKRSANLRKLVGAIKKAASHP